MYTKHDQQRRPNMLTCKPAFALCDFWFFADESFAPVAFPPMLLPLPPAIATVVREYVVKVGLILRRGSRGLRRMG
jgi:hypothetical protein